MNRITGEIVQIDRKRRKLSRVKYGALVGLTGNQVNNIENGRVISNEESESLMPFVLGKDGFDALELEEYEEPIVVKEPLVHPSVLEIVDPKDPGTSPVVLLDEAEEEEDDELLSIGGEQLAFDFTLESIEVKAVEEVQPETSTPVKIVAKYQFKNNGYHISNSELQAFKRCRRKWYLAYYRELRLIRPEITGARSLGTRVHLALSAHYSVEQFDPFEVLQSTIDYDKKILSEGTDVEALLALEKEGELARIMLEGYFQWIEETGQDEDLTVVGNEEVVEVPFPNIPGVFLIGKMDIRTHRKIDDARLFMDHKTVQNLTTPTKTLHMDEQMLMYHLLEFLKHLEQGGDPLYGAYAAGGIYNMLRKVKRTATANPPFYARVEVRHNIHELRAFYIRVFGEVSDIMKTRNELDAGANHIQVAYPSPRSTCSWDCDFISVCPLFDDGSAAEEMLLSQFEPGDPHTHYYPLAEDENERNDA